MMFAKINGINVIPAPHRENETDPVPHSTNLSKQGTPSIESSHL
jgi:hypothetical protein